MAQADHTPLAAIPPRPKKKRTQSGKGKARAVVTASTVAPARPVQESNSDFPASDHAPAWPRPRPRPTGRAKGTTGEIPAQVQILAIEQGPAQGPALTHDPGYQWEPQIVLDPCLDPAFDRNTSLSLTEPLPASEFFPYPLESNTESSENHTLFPTSISNPPASILTSDLDPPCPPGDKGKKSAVPDLGCTLRRSEKVGEVPEPEQTPGRTLRRREKAREKPDLEHTQERTLRRRGREKDVLQMDEPDPEHTSRPKGKKADVLALEEAQQFLPRKKFRRGKNN